LRDLFLDELLEQIPGDQEGHNSACERPEVNNQSTEQKSVKLGLENLSIGVSKHDDGVGYGESENH